MKPLQVGQQRRLDGAIAAYGYDARTLRSARCVGIARAAAAVPRNFILDFRGHSDADLVATVGRRSDVVVQSQEFQVAPGELTTTVWASASVSSVVSQKNTLDMVEEVDLFEGYTPPFSFDHQLSSASLNPGSIGGGLFTVKISGDHFGAHEWNLVLVTASSEKEAVDRVRAVHEFTAPEKIHFDAFDTCWSAPVDLLQIYSTSRSKR